jgi:hypothetical protein
VVYVLAISRNVDEASCLAGYIARSVFNLCGISVVNEFWQMFGVCLLTNDTHFFTLAIWGLSSQSFHLHNFKI